MIHLKKRKFYARKTFKGNGAHSAFLMELKKYEELAKLKDIKKFAILMSKKGKYQEQ